MSSPRHHILPGLLRVAAVGIVAVALVGCTSGGGPSPAGAPYPTASNAGIGDPGRSTPATGNPRADADSASR